MNRLEVPDIWSDSGRRATFTCMQIGRWVEQRAVHRHLWLQLGCVFLCGFSNGRQRVDVVNILDDFGRPLQLFL